MRVMAVVSILCLVLFPLATLAQSLEFRNSVSLGTAGPPSDLSGLTWLGGDEWRAVSDKRNGAPRLAIRINPADGVILEAKIASDDALGPPLEDYEGIAYAPARHGYFVSEESTPAIHEYDLALRQVAAYRPPVGFAGHIRADRGLESLTLNRAGTRLFTANEEALTIDGRGADAVHPTNIRIVEYAVGGDRAGRGVRELRQFVYQVGRVPGADEAGTRHRGQSGLSDMAALPDGKLLMLERSVYYTTIFGQDIPHFQSRIYLVDLSGATPLVDPRLSILSPVNAPASTPVPKKLLYEGSLFNMEGLAVGPATRRGVSILGITDNQLNETRGLIADEIYAFEYIPAK